MFLQKNRGMDNQHKENAWVREEELPYKALQQSTG